MSLINIVLDDGKILFTRKGELIFNKVIKEYPLKKGDKVLVKDGVSVLEGDPLYENKKGVVKSENIALSIVKDDAVYLVEKEVSTEIKNGSTVKVKVGDFVRQGEEVAKFDTFAEPIIAEDDGYIHFEDVIAGTTLNEEIDENTGFTIKRIADLHFDKLQPHAFISDEAGNPVSNTSYFLPAGSQIMLDEGEKVKAGTVIARISKATAKTKDITGGLPRVTELFEARKPKTIAVLSKITGTVNIKKGVIKAKRLVVVKDDYGNEFKHLIPIANRLLVRDGDLVKAGEPLCDGNFDPHDILSILGENALQNYLMNEVRDVYRAHGVTINDKHIGIIVRQMLKKVKIVSVGDTSFIFDQAVDKYKFHEENAKITAEGGQPAIAKPLFQGITKASLNIDSFISAASFQETTRVLTNAAISGVTDYLKGLKENVVIGHLIPAGTGMKRYGNVKLFDKDMADLDVQMNEILERRRLEATQVVKEEEREYFDDEEIMLDD